MCAPRCGSSGTCRRARSIRSRREESSCRRGCSPPPWPRGGSRVEICGRARLHPHQRRAWRRDAPRGRDAQAGPASVAAPDQRRHDRRRSGIHRPRTRWQRHDARPRRHRSHRDGAGAIAGRPAGDVVEGRARHHDRRSADGRRCARDSAAASSRSGRSRALRREGASPARVDPDRRHPHHAARAIVCRSVAAGHRSVGAPVVERISGQVARGASRPGGDHRGRPRHGRRARHRGSHVHVGIGGGFVGVDDLPGVIGELDRLHRARGAGGSRGGLFAPWAARRDGARVGRRRHGARVTCR